MKRRNTGKSKGTKRTKSTTPSATKTTRRKANYYPLYKPVDAGKMAFPMQFQNQLTYCDSTSYSVGIGNFNTQVYSCNGLYDPNITGTGGQPLYFDQLTAIYDHYTVLSSYIVVECTGVGTVASNYASRVGLYIDDDTSYVSSMDSLIQRQGAKFSVVNFAQGGKVHLTFGWNASKTFPGNPLGNTDLQGTASGNPAEQSYFVIGMDAPDGVAVTFYLTVKVVYNVVWDEKKTIGDS